MGERIAALPESPAADVFDRTVLRRLVAEHRSGAKDHSEMLWTALNLSTWREVFGC
jgi:asparagine synthase (glutamine-hydrolysing)